MARFEKDRDALDVWLLLGETEKKALIEVSLGQSEVDPDLIINTYGQLTKDVLKFFGNNVPVTIRVMNYGDTAKEHYGCFNEKA
jgi:hypothetical protein